jgi:tellurite resistance protein TerC
MIPVSLFPFAEYWWFYTAFGIFVVGLLAIDLGLFHREAHTVTFREAGIWSAVWVSLALAFNFGFYQYMLHHFPSDPRLMALPGFAPETAARQAALEFLAGYVVEYSLSIDNIFVFVIVLGYFGIPSRLQHRVLFFGILGALVFRGLFIAMGALLLRYQWVVWVFGVFLVVTGIRMMMGKGDDLKPDENPLLRLFRRFIPVTTDIRGSTFLVREKGKLFATPLLVAVFFLEMTDIVFAVDSVPAIFALTREPLVVFTSNIFAILGLRNLYFLLRNAIDTFYLLKYGLGIVLVFVGLKMVWLNHAFGGHFPIVWSLAIIIGVIGASILLSVAFPKAPAGRQDTASPEDAA